MRNILSSNQIGNILSSNPIRYSAVVRVCAIVTYPVLDSLELSCHFVSRNGGANSKSNPFCVCAPPKGDLLKDWLEIMRFVLALGRRQIRLRYTHVNCQYVGVSLVGSLRVSMHTNIKCTERRRQPTKGSCATHFWIAMIVAPALSISLSN